MADNNNETTTKFKVDISELKKSMQEAKRSIAVANSEFKAVSSTMDNWSESTDGISAKLRQLDSNLNSQKSILKSLEKQYELTVKEMGEGSKAADDLKIKINNQKAVVNKTEREIDDYNQTLKEVAEAEKTAAKTGKTVAEVLKDVGDEAEGASDGFTVLKGAVATFAGNVLTGLANGLKNAATNFFNLAEETREYRTELAKMNTAATTAGASADYIKDKWHDLGAVLGDEGAVAEGLNNLMAAGFTTEAEMDAISKSLEGAAIKWKDTLKFEGLADGLQETLATGAAVGSFGEMLERSGINLDTFNAGLAECTSEADKQNFVLKQLSSLGLDEVSEAYRSQNKDLIAANKANSKYADNMATIGAKIEPVTTSIKNGFNSLLEKVLELVEGVDMGAFTSAIESGFEVLTNDVLPAVKEGLGWILDNKDTLVAGLAAIAAGFIAFKVASLIQSVVSAMKGMTLAQTALNLAMSLNPIGLIVAAIAGLVAAFIALWNNSEAFRGFWIGLWENIKSAFDAAISGIVTFFTETIPAVFNGVINFIKENWDTLLLFLINPFAGLFKFFYENNTKFKEFVDNAIESIKNFPNKIKEILNKVASFFAELPEKMGYLLGLAIGQVIQWGINLYNFATTQIPKFINRVIEFIKQLPSKVQTWLVQTVAKVSKWGVDMAAKAKQSALNFIDKVVEFIKQLPSKVFTWLSTTASRVGDWGTTLARKGKEAATKLFNSVTDKIKALPSSLKSIGSDIVKGLWNGINDMAGWISGKIKSFGDGVLSGIKDFFGIHSPSRLMRDEVGKFIPQGIAVGIDKNAKSVLNSMRELTTGTVAAARENLRAGTGTGTGNTANTGGTTYNFYQTNNSPKTLSRLDIYRQTKNLLGFSGGV